MNWPLAWNIIAGTFPGLFLGMIIRILYLPDPRPFKLFAGLMLLYIGARMVYQLIADRGAAESAAKIAEDKMRKEAVLRPEKGGPSQPKSSAICTISWSLKRTEVPIFRGMLQLPHHRPFYSVSGRRADRRYLWNRWRSDYRSFHCLIFSPSHPYDCRRDFDGNMRNFNRGSNLLSIDRTIFCYRGRGCFAGLAARVSLWHRWIRRDVSGSRNPEIRSRSHYWAGSGDFDHYRGSAVRGRLFLMRLRYFF